MNSEKKKRLIIPAVTLVVAIVMMAGVGYAALNSTFTVNGNSTVGAGLEVTMDEVQLSNNKIMDGAKIPYAVDSVAGNPTKTYKIDSGTYVLVKNKKISINDDEGLYSSYNISIEMLNVTLPGDKLTLKGIFTNGNYDDNSTPISKISASDKNNLKLTIVLESTGYTTTDHADIDKLGIEGITIIISVNGVA